MVEGAEGQGLTPVAQGQQEGGLPELGGVVYSPSLPPHSGWQKNESLDFHESP